LTSIAHWRVESASTKQYVARTATAYYTVLNQAEVPTRADALRLTHLSKRHRRMYRTWNATNIKG